MTAIEILGLAAGTISSITFLPQVTRIWKTKSAKDLSMNMLFLLILGVSMWLVYGVVQKDLAIIYTNSMVLVMSVIMFFFKIKFMYAVWKKIVSPGPTITGVFLQ